MHINVHFLCKLFIEVLEYATVASGYDIKPHTCKECGVNFNGFSAYMRGKNEYAIFAEKLELLRKASLDKINELLSIDESK